MSKPLCIDLFCGLGGWTRGFLAEGWDCIGFDIERHRYPKREFSVEAEAQKSMAGKNKNGTTLMNRALEQVHGFHHAPLTGEWMEYPAQLVIQDVLTLHGSQFRDAVCIVASPPCQKYSYMGMPWTRAKQLAAWYREDEARITELNALFEACFRIQYEAIEAAGHHIPLIVENVNRAQAWVGSARWHFGSYYLWGDVPALMPTTRQLKRPGRNSHAFENGLGSSPSFNGAEHETRGVTDGLKVPGINWSDRTKPARGFNVVARQRLAESRRIDAATKNNGGSWFGVAHNTESGLGRNPVNGDGIKQHGSGQSWFDKALDERRKQAGDSFGWPKDTPLRNNNSKSSARKAASAQIAEIPFELASYIARVFRP